MKNCKWCKLDQEDSFFRISKKTGKLLNPCFNCRKKEKEEYNKTHTKINNSTKKTWAQKYPEKVRVARKKWKDENIGKVKADKASRKERISKATPKWLTPDQLYAIELVYMMAEIRSMSGTKYHVDHIIPINGETVCGLHVPWNLETLKAEENLKKVTNCCGGGQMDNKNTSLLYFATDGDGIGRRHAEAILSDDADNVSNVSSEITHANEMIHDFVESNGGRMISFGGDETVFSAPAEFVELLEQLRKDYQYMVGATLSIGYGRKLSEAAKALLAAKERGKDQVVQYDESAEQDAQKTQEARNQEESESEVGEVGLKQSNVEQQSDENNNREGNPHQESQGGYANEVASDGIDRDDPPVYDNNHQYDSGYKNSDKEVRGESYREEDLTPPVIAKPNLTPKQPVMEATSGDVPETSRPMNNVASNPGEQEPEDKKPTSKYYDGQAEWIKPDQDENGAPQSMADATNENRPSDLKYMRHGQQEPQADMAQEDSTSDVAEADMAQDMQSQDAQQETPIEEVGQHCPSCTCDAHNDQSAEQVLDQHVDNASDYTNSIGEGGDSGNQGSSGEGESVEDLLDQHLDNAADMEGKGDVDPEGMDPNGISRPDDYDAKQGDMGLSEEDAQSDEPNLDEVLRDGLDSHADSIQREKVIDMVGQALEAFKGQKQILDKAKEQAPELHDACISMLRAMIELCSLAGIDQSQPEQDVNEIEGGDAVPAEAPDSQEMPPEGVSSESNSEEACPNCGHDKANPAAPQEGSPKAEAAGTIGSVKKLPTKHSTPHIPKETTPVGGVNAKGQKRYVDPTTGKDAYVDMKVGKVLGPRGIPVNE